MLWNRSKVENRVLISCKSNFLLTACLANFNQIRFPGSQTKFPRVCWKTNPLPASQDTHQYFMAFPFLVISFNKSACKHINGLYLLRPVWVYILHMCFIDVGWKRIIRECRFTVQHKRYLIPIPWCEIKVFTERAGKVRFLSAIEGYVPVMLHMAKIRKKKFDRCIAFCAIILWHANSAIGANMTRWRYRSLLGTL